MVRSKLIIIFLYFCKGNVKDDKKKKKEEIVLRDLRFEKPIEGGHRVRIFKQMAYS